MLKQITALLFFISSFFIVSSLHASASRAWHPCETDIFFDYTTHSPALRNLVRTHWHPQETAFTGRSVSCASIKAGMVRQRAQLIDQKKATDITLYLSHAEAVRRRATLSDKVVTNALKRLEEEKNYRVEAGKKAAESHEQAVELRKQRKVYNHGRSLSRKELKAQ